MPSMPAANNASVAAAAPVTQAGNLPALNGLPALAAATSAGTSAATGTSANFLQLLAQLVGAPSTTETTPLAMATDGPSEKPDDKASSDGDPPGEDAEILAALALIPGFCPTPLQTEISANGQSDAKPATASTPTQNSDTAAKELLTALTDASFNLSTADDTAIQANTSELLANASPLLAKTGNAAAPSSTIAAAPLAAATDPSVLLDKLSKSVDEPASVSSIDPNSNLQSSQLHAAVAAHAHANSDAPPPAELRSPVGTPAWREELGTQLTWMAHRGVESASLRLSPEHLGPLEVRISMHAGEASVWFGAANADTRSALDQSLPQLREMFASQGLVLADAGVFRDAPRGQPKSVSVSSAGNRIGTAATEPITRAVALSIRLLDTYA